MKQIIPQEIVDQLQEQFLGKRISVEDEKGERWVGECQFIGPNPFFPSWGLQVTINRTPVTNVKIKSIHLK
jgi:hypothetical protein